LEHSFSEEKSTLLKGETETPSPRHFNPLSSSCVRLGPLLAGNLPLFIKKEKKKERETRLYPRLEEKGFYKLTRKEKRVLHRPVLGEGGRKKCLTTEKTSSGSGPRKGKKIPSYTRTRRGNTSINPEKGADGEGRGPRRKGNFCVGKKKGGKNIYHLLT